MIDLLNTKINNRKGSELFIAFLDDNGWVFHFDDDPYDCLDFLDSKTIGKIKARIDEIYALDIWTRHDCPIGIALDVIHKKDILPKACAENGIHKALIVIQKHFELDGCGIADTHFSSENLRLLEDNWTTISADDKHIILCEYFDAQSADINQNPEEY